MAATVISIATHKGGVGKTVNAMAIAAAFARAGQPSLLVDMDPQGHSTLGLGIDVGDDEPTLRELFVDDTMSAESIILETHLPDLHVLPSNISLAPVAQSLHVRPRREELLRRSLVPIRDRYSYIVVDCSPSLGVLTEMSVAVANLIIIPCQMEARAADGLVDLLEMIALIRSPSFDAWCILLTKVDSRKSVTNHAIMAALERWWDKIFKTQIPISEPLNQAQIERTDIFTFDPHCSGARAYEELALELYEDQSYPRGADRRQAADAQ